MKKRAQLVSLLATTSVLSMFAASASAQQTTATYTYDALGRLKVVDRAAAGKATYAYDAADNRSSVVVVASTLPTAANDTVVTAYNTSVTISVLVNDNDPDGNALSVTQINGQTAAAGTAITVTGGTATLNANKTITFTPTSGTSGTSNFSYTISNGHGGTASATASVIVSAGPPVNHNPTATSDSAATAFNTATTLSVLANDTDSDGDTLSVTQIAGVAAMVGTPVTVSHGAATLNANKTITFTPTTGYSGAASFTYTVSDGHGGTTTATASITVAAAPSNLLVNGSFEAQSVPVGTAVDGAIVTGWTAISDGQIEVWNHVAGEENGNGVWYVHAGATDGSNYLELDDDSARDGFYQDVTTVAGTSYTLTFDARLREGASQGWTGATQGIEVLWNGTLITTITPTSIDWAQKSVMVTGTGGSDRLTIQEVASQGADGIGALLDNFKLIAGSAPPSNHAPVGVNDTATTAYNTAVSLSVLANDTDADSDTLSVTQIQGVTAVVGTAITVTGGTATLNANGSIAYTPNAGFNGASGFTYTVSDGHGGTSTATAAVTVSAPANHNPAATNDSATTALNTATTLSVLANDTDSDGDTLSITQIAGVAATVGAPVTVSHGTATLNANGTITFTPTTGYSGAASFTYTVSDGHGGTTTATASIPVSAGSGSNLLINGSFEAQSVLVGEAVDGAIVTGWTAISGGEIEVWNAVVGEQDASGNWHLHAGATDGSNFLELDDESDRDGFYQDVTTTSGTSYTLTFDARLREGPLQGWTSATQGIEVLWNGTLITTITPTSIDWSQKSVTVTGTGGSDRLTIQEVASQGADGIGALLDNFKLIAGSALPSNHAPVGVNDTATTAYNTATTLSVLANDTDADSDTLSVSQIQGVTATVGTAITVTGGTATLNANGTITYTPSAGFNGVGGFTYAVSDGHGGTSTATAAVTVSAPVNHNPTATNDSQTTAFNTAIAISVLTNDTDSDGDTLSVTQIAGVAATVGTPVTVTHGAATLNANGSITYTPTTGYSGSDSFTYTVSDGRGGTATATASVTVAAATNHNPTATNDTATTAYNTATTITVLANDTDSDGDALSVIQIQGVTAAVGTAIAATNGTATLNANNTITFIPTSGYSGSGGGFTYTISDGHGGTSTATASITVAAAPVNHTPTPANDTTATAYNTATMLGVLANDTDVDGDTLSVTQIQGVTAVVGTPVTASHGTATLNANGSITFTPTSGYSGSAGGFTYAVSDGHGGTSTATASITVYAPASHPPVAANDTAEIFVWEFPNDTVNYDGSVYVLANDTDADFPNDILSIISVSNSYFGIEGSGGTYLSWHGPMPIIGTVTASYTIQDLQSHTATASVAITTYVIVCGEFEC
jgi:hypothetical protein